MPNHLTDEQKAKVKIFISKLKNCPACGSNKFSLEDIVVVNPFYAGAIHAGIDSVPMLQVVCSDCFYICHFAAKQMGLP